MGMNGSQWVEELVKCEYFMVWCKLLAKSCSLGSEAPFPLEVTHPWLMMPSPKQGLSFSVFITLDIKTHTLTRLGAAQGKHKHVKRNLKTVFLSPWISGVLHFFLIWDPTQINNLPVQCIHYVESYIISTVLGEERRRKKYARMKRCDYCWIATGKQFH